MLSIIVNVDCYCMDFDSFFDVAFVTLSYDKCLFF